MKTINTAQGLMTNLWDAIKHCAPTKRVAGRDLDHSLVKVDEDGYAKVSEVLKELQRLYPKSQKRIDFCKDIPEDDKDFLDVYNVQDDDDDDEFDDNLEEEREEEEVNVDDVSEIKIVASVLKSQAQVYQALKGSGNDMLASRVLVAMTDCQRIIEAYNKKTKEDFDAPIIASDLVPNASEEQLREIGRLAAYFYRQKYNRFPPQVARFINGKSTLVNKYTNETAPHTLNRAIGIVFKDE